MTRKHFFEFHDQEWCPNILRRLFTEFISHYEMEEDVYGAVAGLLSNRLAQTGEHSIIDFCSGAGSPVVSVVNGFGPDLKRRIEITLSDKYPNVEAWKKLSEKSGLRVKYSAGPVDALHPNHEMQGFRTFFSSFHHFKPEQCRAILINAIKSGQRIGVFEYTIRDLLREPSGFLFVQKKLYASVFRMKPFKWQRLLWIYLLPVLPFMMLWDGIVSCLRTYTVGEIREIIGKIPEQGYVWEVGEIAGKYRIIYLIGQPAGKCCLRP